MLIRVVAEEKALKEVVPDEKATFEAEEKALKEVVDMLYRAWLLPSSRMWAKECR